jgi:thiol-disulfide isomerase/thioredoxin
MSSGDMLVPKKISTNTVILIVVFFALTVLFVLLMTRSSRADKMRKQRMMNMKYYYTPRCHHCRHFSPVWDEFVSKVSDKAVCEKIDCSENPELCRDIVGVPHIVASSPMRNTSSVYNGDRNLNGLVSFLEKFDSK